MNSLKIDVLIEKGEMMDRIKLVNTLDLVSRALPDNDLIEILKSFLFKDGTVMAYNDTIGIRISCEVEDEFVVEGATLRDLLKNSTAEEADFSLEKDHLLVTTGKGTFKLPYNPTDEYPFEEPDDEWDISISLDEALIKGLDTCLLTASRDLTQEALMGVSLRAMGKVLALYSCDGDALTRFCTSAPAKGFKQPYMLPNSFCESLSKVFTELGGKAKLEVNSEWAKATLGDCTIYGRIRNNDNEFDFEHHIKRAVKKEKPAVTLPLDFNEALSRARVISDREGKPTGLSIVKGKLNMVTETHLGIVRDSMTIRGHEDAEAFISAKLVQRAVTVCNQIAVHENCCVFTEDDTLLQIVSNLNE